MPMQNAGKPMTEATAIAVDQVVIEAGADLPRSFMLPRGNFRFAFEDAVKLPAP